MDNLLVTVPSYEVRLREDTAAEVDWDEENEYGFVSFLAEYTKRMEQSEATWMAESALSGLTLGDVYQPEADFDMSDIGCSKLYVFDSLPTGPITMDQLLAVRMSWVTVPIERRSAD